MYRGEHNTTTQQQIYALRYQAYLGKNSINPNDKKLFSDRYDNAENCHSHIEYIGEQPAGSIRACIYDPARPALDIPAMENYGEEIACALGHDKIVVEANKYSVHPEFQCRSMALKVALYSYILRVALEVRADFVIGAVRLDQCGFYRRMGFSPVSDVKSSLHMKFSTTLMATSTHDLKNCFIRHRRAYN